MALWFIFNYKILPLSAGELGGPGLLGVKVIKSRLAGDNFPILGNLQPLGI